MCPPRPPRRRGFRYKSKPEIIRSNTDNAKELRYLMEYVERLENDEYFVPVYEIFLDEAETDVE